MNLRPSSTVLTAVFTGAALFSTISRADDPMRCGSALVTTAATPEELVQKCGEPDSKKVTEEDIRACLAFAADRERYTL